MIGLAARVDAESPDPYYPGDDADAPPCLFEPRPLLDMRLQITEMPCRIEAVGIGDRLDIGEHRAQPHLAALGGVDLGVGQVVAERPAAEKGEVGALLVLERHHVDPDRR